jgi:hypothetical protein
MNDGTRMALAVESIFYESVVNGLVATHKDGAQLGLSREELLYSHTCLFLKDIDTPERLASLAAMMVCMLAEERATV